MENALVVGGVWAKKRRIRGERRRGRARRVNLGDISLAGTKNRDSDSKDIERGKEKGEEYEGDEGHGS